MSFRHVLLTDPGIERDNNEDAAQAVPEHGLYVIADGMGGHLGGEVASQLAVETIVARVGARKVPRRIRDEAPILGEAILEANQAMRQRAVELGLHGMGTTITAVLIRGRTAVIGHVGDTRAYRLSRRSMKQLTRDHTLVALLLETGVIRESEAFDHPDRHVLTQAAGPQDEIEPETYVVRLPRGVRLLLSTDGLHDVVRPERIHEIAMHAQLDVAAQKLIDAAIDAGGPDNVSVILIQT